MITLAQLLRTHQSEFTSRYHTQLNASHRAAQQAILTCHTPASGYLEYECSPCHKQQHYYRSCGHRSCPACQHHVNNQWLDRQRQKLLPVDYYLVTFTVPYELRSFVWHHQRWAYQALFQTAVDTLTKFASNDPQLGSELGMTGVLHTHSRRLDFHPHVHFVVPGGALNKKRSQWRQKTKRYLFNGKALATVFRAKFIAAMKDQGFTVPKKTPAHWISHCEHVGKGEPALVYLARYLYRGVVSEQNITGYHNGQVTFRYRDSASKQWKTRTESAVKFLWLVLQHVLPKGFRRVRDYGFLHGNAKKIRLRLQLILRVLLPDKIIEVARKISCPCCGEPMTFVRFTRYIPIIKKITTG